MMRVRHNFNPVIWSGKSKLTMGGGGSPPSPPTNPATTALLAKMAVQPSAPLEALINDFFNSVDNDIGLGGFDGIWWHNLETQQQSLLNWIAPAGTPATNVGTLTWATKLGFTGTGTSGHYVDYNVLMQGGGNYTQNDCCFGAWDSSNNSSNTYIVGVTGSSNIRLLPRSGVNQFSCNINSASAGPGGANGNSEHFYSVNRSGSTQSNAYIDGADIGGTQTAASSSIASMGNFVGLRSLTTYSARRLLMSFEGGSLDATEQAALWNAANAFKTGVDAL